MTLVVVAVMSIAYMVLNLVDYSVAQNYAQVATQQVNGDDSAYYLLNTRPTADKWILLFNLAIAFAGGFVVYLIFNKKPKKVE